MSFAERWRRYWFSPAPLLDLAVVRIIVVGWQLIDLIRWNPPADAFRKLAETPEMFWPLPVLRLLLLPFGWNTIPSYLATSLIFDVTLLAGVAAVLGWRTRWALGAFTVGSIFVQSYAYSFNEIHHPEAILMLALAALTLSPSGRVLSVDSIRRPTPISTLDPEAGWAIKLMRWLFALVYFSAAYFKLKTGGHEWLNGYTLQYYLLQDGLRWGRPLGVALASNHGLALVSSWVCVLFEGTFFLCAFFPALAWIYVPAGILLHGGIYVAMAAPFFSFIALYSVFVPWSRAWDRLTNTRHGALEERRNEISNEQRQFDLRLHEHGRFTPPRRAASATAGNGLEAGTVAHDDVLARAGTGLDIDARPSG